MNEGKSVRSRRVGPGRGVCGVARLGRGARHGLRRAPCIRSLAGANAAHAEYSDKLLVLEEAAQAVDSTAPEE
jgi:hypothetical protein